MNDRTNTIFGWVLFSGVVALGLTSISSRIYNADNPEVPEQAGYFIEVAEEEGAADAGPSLAMLLASGTASAGEAVYAKCSACHTIEQGGAVGIGPNLHGVLGQPIAEHSPGFAYSGALAEKDGAWDYENMDAWLQSPRSFANGTKMSFAGLSSPEDRANVILYLRENGGGPPLPEPEAPAEETDEAAGDAGETADADGTVDDTEQAPTDPDNVTG